VAWISVGIEDINILGPYEFLHVDPWSARGVFLQLDLLAREELPVKFEGLQLLDRQQVLDRDAHLHVVGS
jgi:hypothetical protein